MLHLNVFGSPHGFEAVITALTSAPLMTSAVFAAATDVNQGGLIAQLDLRFRV